MWKYTSSILQKHHQKNFSGSIYNSLHLIHILVVKFISQCVLHNTKQTNVTPELWKSQYLRHNAAVKNLVPKDKFLEFNAKQGWRPLCEFLGEI